MKIFQHANTDEGGKACPVCHKREDKPVVLIGIVGTEEGRIMEAVQVHVDCLDLAYYPGQEIIAMKVGV